MAGVASALCEQASSFSGSLVRMVNNHTVDARDGTLCVCVCTVHVCVGTVVMNPPLGRPVQGLFPWSHDLCSRLLCAVPTEREAR